MQIANTADFMLFCLILMRMSGFVFLNPILGRKNIPSMMKSGFALVLTVMIYSVSAGTQIEVTNSFVYAVLLLKEFALGYLLGFVMQLFEFAITYAGAIMDFQMGLSMSTVYDVQSGVQIALTGNILQIFYMLLFFAVDGHLALMKILVTSASVVPYGEVHFAAGGVMAILSIFTQCVVIAVKLSFPLIAIELLSEMGVGILMKIIPQINIFVLNIQLKVLLGIVMLLFLCSPISDYLGTVIATMMTSVQEALKLAR